MSLKQLLGTVAGVVVLGGETALAFDVKTEGRIRFTAMSGERHLDGRVDLLNASNALADTSTATQFSPQGFLPREADVEFSLVERFDVKVDIGTRAKGYGAMLRLEDESVKSDIYLRGAWGRLDFGNLDNAHSGAYNTSDGAVGPLFPTRNVAVVNLNSSNNEQDRFLGLFDNSPVDEINVVYLPPKIGGKKAPLGLRIVPKIGTDGKDVEASFTAFTGPIELKMATDNTGRAGALMRYKTGKFMLSAFTAEDDDGDSYAGGNLRFVDGALSLSLGANRIKGNDSATLTSGARLQFDAKETEVVAGAAYKVASGLTASASIRSQDFESVAVSAVSPGQITDFAARLQLEF